MSVVTMVMRAFVQLCISILLCGGFCAFVIFFLSSSSPSPFHHGKSWHPACKIVCLWIYIVSNKLLHKFLGLIPVDLTSVISMMLDNFYYVIEYISFCEQGCAIKKSTNRWFNSGLRQGLQWVKLLRLLKMLKRH